MNEIIKKNGITYGIILGIFSILVTASIYAIDISLFLKWYVGVFSMLIALIIGIMAIVNTKKKLGNFISFKEAFTVYFITGVIATVMSVLFSIVLFNYVDPGAKETLKEMTMKYTVDMMQNMGVPASATNEAVAKMQEQDTYSPMQQMFGMLVSFVLHAIVGAILGLIFRNKTEPK